MSCINHINHTVSWENSLKEKCKRSGSFALRLISALLQFVLLIVWWSAWRLSLHYLVEILVVIMVATDVARQVRSPEFFIMNLQWAVDCCPSGTHCCGSTGQGCCPNERRCCFAPGSDPYGSASFCCLPGESCCPNSCCQPGSQHCNDAGDCIP